MIKIRTCFLFLVLTTTLNAQQTRFMFIETDNGGEPFYELKDGQTIELIWRVMVAGEVYDEGSVTMSTSSGWCYTAITVPDTGLYNFYICALEQQKWTWDWYDCKVWCDVNSDLYHVAEYDPAIYIPDDDWTVWVTI